MKAMLDSNTCIYLMNRRAGIVEREPLHECCISTIVLGELEYGYLKSDRRAENRVKLNLFLGAITIFSVGETESKVWAEIRLALNKEQVGRNGMWIAAHAIALDLPLVTNNEKEFKRVPGWSLITGSKFSTQNTNFYGCTAKSCLVDLSTY